MYNISLHVCVAAHQDRLVQQGGRSVGPTILSSLIYSENDQLAFREFINIHSDFFTDLTDLVTDLTDLVTAFFLVPSLVTDLCSRISTVPAQINRKLA